MKPKFLVLLATAVLWIGTLVGAYQIGYRRTAEADGTDLAAGGTWNGPDGTSRRSRDRSRSETRPQNVKEIFSQLRSLMGQGDLTDSIGVLRIIGLLEKIQPEDLDEAMAEAWTLKDPDDKMAIVTTLLAKWAERDGTAAMKYADEHSKDTGLMGAGMKVSVATAWAASDPEAFWQWYMGNKDRDEGLVEGGRSALFTLFSRLMATDPDAAFKRLDKLDEVSRHWAFEGMSQAAAHDSVKLDALLRHIGAMSGEDGKSKALETLLGHWARGGLRMPPPMLGNCHPSNKEHYGNLSAGL